MQWSNCQRRLLVAVKHARRDLFRIQTVTIRTTTPKLDTQTKLAHLSCWLGWARRGNGGFQEPLVGLYVRDGRNLVIATIDRDALGRWLWVALLRNEQLF